MHSLIWGYPCINNSLAFKFCIGSLAAAFVTVYPDYGFIKTCVTE